MAGSEHSLLSNTPGEAQALSKLLEEESTVHPDTDPESLTNIQSSSDHQLLLQPLSSLSPPSGPLPRDPQMLARSQESCLSYLASVPQGTLEHSGGLSLSGSLGALPSLSSLAHSQETSSSPLQSLSLSALGGLSLGNPSGAFSSFDSQAQTRESSSSPLSPRPLSTLASSGGPSLSGPLGAFPSLSSLAHSEESSHSPHSSAPLNFLVRSEALQTEQSAVGTSKSPLSTPLSGLAHSNVQGPPSRHSLSRTQHEEKSELISPKKNTTVLQSSPFSAMTSPSETSCNPQLTAAVSLSDLAKLQSTSATPTSIFESLAKKPAPPASESQRLGSQSRDNAVIGGVSLSELAGPARASPTSGSHSTLGSISLSELARLESSSVPLTQVPPRHVASAPDKLTSGEVPSPGHTGFPTGLQVRSQPPGLCEPLLAKDLQGLSLSELGMSHTSSIHARLPNAPAQLMDTSRFDDQKCSQDLPDKLVSISLNSKSSVSAAVSVIKPQVKNSKPLKTLESSLTNAPSMFALTLCYRAPGCADQNVRARRAGHHRPTSPVCVVDLSITPFDFSTPSPDDVVFAKQRKAFSKNKR